MKHLWIVLLTVFLASQAFAQAPPKITLEGLKARIEANPDTLYVVNYWATWCKPCVEEMPYFEEVNKTMSDKKVKVIFVSLDLASEYEKRLAQFLKKKDLKSEVLFLNEPKIQTKIDEIDPSWNGSLPATLFFRKGTNTRLFHEGDYDLEALMNEITQLI